MRGGSDLACESLSARYLERLWKLGLGDQSSATATTSVLRKLMLVKEQSHSQVCFKVARWSMEADGF